MLRTLTWVVRHPLNRHQPLRAVGRYLAWQLSSRALGQKVAVPFVGRTRLCVGRGMTGATGCVYAGLHEFEDMAFVLHALTPADQFFDVGANVGSYSVLAGGAVGATTFSFEPIPQTFAHLMDNLRLNDLLGRVEAHNVAVGGEPSRLRFTSGHDTMNRALGSGESAADAVEVPVIRLDDFAARIAAPFVIKVDVEGFESEVVRGGGAVFGDPRLLAVLIELNGLGARYGYDEAAIHKRLLSVGLRPARYDPSARALAPSAAEGPLHNTLYVRQWDEVAHRLAAAPRYEVNGQSI